MTTGMVLADTLAGTRAFLAERRAPGIGVGLVPTMGALHEGHLSLVRRARQENDLVVVSIFVNPTQFGPSEDFAKYPRDLEGDLRVLREAGCDLAFSPPADEMYAHDHSTWVEVEGLTAGLCGRSRPGHFRGVCTVVAKLIGICGPDRAYFGEKDAQQLAVIERMVRDLNLATEIVPCPIVRENDGLAMSSRNARLSPEARSQAPVLYRALTAAEGAVREGERDARTLETLVRSVLAEAPLAEVDYVEIVRAEDLRSVIDISETPDGTCLIAVAVRFGDVRLIDNVRVRA